MENFKTIEIINFVKVNLERNYEFIRLVSLNKEIDLFKNK